MRKVREQKKHGDDVAERNPRISERVVHHLVNVEDLVGNGCGIVPVLSEIAEDPFAADSRNRCRIFISGKTSGFFEDRELAKVPDNERDDRDSRENHGARGPCGIAGRFHGIAFGSARGKVFKLQLDGERKVNHDAGKNHYAESPKRYRRQRVKKVRIGIDFFRSLEHLQVAHDVDKQEQDKDKTRHSHQVFFYQRRHAAGIGTTTALFAHIFVGGLFFLVRKV